MLISKFYKQVDGCSMGRPLSVIFSSIYMTKTERKVTEPNKPKFYKRFINDTTNKLYKDHVGYPEGLTTLSLSGVACNQTGN